MSKTVDTYRAALTEALRQLSEARVKRESLTLQLDKVNGQINNLGEAATSIGHLCGVDVKSEHPDLFPEETEPEMGFTDAVREVFKRLPVDEWLGPIHVRTELQELGFPLQKYKNPLASIHTILKRLNSQGELNMMVFEDTLRFARKEPDKSNKK